ncbi:MAG: hypothetical protein GY820_19145, partial [Gammaproteobacteria bacterium]|nr:hypothetical protein [Gammaproteobacteria bacterium]
MMKGKIYWLFGLILILTFCLSETAEAEGYSAVSGINGAVGAKSSGSNSGNTGNTGHGGGSSGSRCGETSGRPDLPKPEPDNKGRGGGRVKKQQRRRKNKNKRREKSGNRKRKKRSVRLPLSSSGNDIKKVIRSKKKSKIKKAAKKIVEAAEKLMDGQCEKRAEITRVERVDDVPLLLAVMMRMKLHEVLDNHIPVHWKQRDLSWGLTCIIWLAYILSEGDHRKVSVREYVKKILVTLSIITGRKIDELDFTDDRLGLLLKYLGNKSYWDKIEKEISECSIEAYELQTDTVRCDATTASGHHEIKEDGLFQKGVSKDNPKLPQIKIMIGAPDPLGMPLATDVVSGEKADDVLYRPVIRRINEYLEDKDVLYVGDSKLSAFDTRLYIKGIGKHYLCPLPQTGKTAVRMEQWIKIGIMADRENALNRVYVKKDDEEKLTAKGYEFERSLSGETEGKKTEWNERVLIVNSPSYAKSQADGLERRLANAVEKLYALTPPRGPGKRQITEEKGLKAAIARILKHHKVERMICCKYEKETERQEKYVGRGKGSANRPKKITERVRYQMLQVRRNEYRIKKEKEKQGWKVFVTDASPKRLCFGGIVKCYRKEYRVERIFNRLKSRMNIAPLFVKRDD